MSTTKSEISTESNTSILKFSIIEAVILIFIFLVFLTVLNYFNIVRLETISSHLSFLPTKTKSASPNSPPTQLLAVAPTYSIVEQTIESTGSAFTNPVLVAEDLAMVTISGYIRELINKDSQIALYVIKDDGTAIKEILPITNNTQIMLAQGATPEQEITVAEIRPYDRAMVSYNIIPSTQEVFISGVRIIR